MSHRILLVDDEVDILEFVRYNLVREGYEVYTAQNGAEALQRAAACRPHLILLDMMMPVMDGVETCRAIRRDPRLRDTMIVFLSALGEEEQQLAGFGVGADDYLTKPFLTEELLARLRALVRRSSGMNDEAQLSGGDIVLDETTLTLRNVHTGESVRLGDKEFRILEYFLRNRGRILTRDQLVQRVWGYDSDAEYNKIEVYLTFTRKKLAFIGSDARIKAVRGVGYELQLPDEVRS